ncbi:MAG: AI-2E family transporter [Patescibacteria group bacterium]|nr:AI-2E family transporter [Patescibacteria group bacterium]
MNYKKFQTYFFLSCLAGSIALTVLVFRSYLVALAFGGVIAIVTRPIFKFIYRYLKSEVAAAFLTIILVMAAFLSPTIFFLAAFVNEIGAYLGNAGHLLDINNLMEALRRVLPVSWHAQIPAISGELLKILTTVLEKLSADIIGFFSNAMDVFLNAVVMMFSAYYLLKDGTRIKKELLFLSPLSDENDEMIFQRLVQSVAAVLNGTIVVGIIKGIIAAVAFWATGVPAPIFWGAMTGVSSLLPVVGTSIVTVPAIVYLVVSGQLGAAVVLTVISVAIIGAIDNFLQPKLVQRRTDIHPLLVLLSIVGGIEFYGFAGFILGPLTVSVALALIDIYRREFKEDVENPGILGHLRGE